MRIVANFGRLAASEATAGSDEPRFLKTFQVCLATDETLHGAVIGDASSAAIS